VAEQCEGRFYGSELESGWIYLTSWQQMLLEGICTTLKLPGREEFANDEQAARSNLWWTWVRQSPLDPE